ncbi:MAG: hypothetical protein R3B09_33220 [Nannocystaceae bacterium]
MPPAPSLPITIAFVALVFAMIGLLLGATAWASKRLGEGSAERRQRITGAVMVIGLWMIVSSGLAGAGILANFTSFPPPIGRLLIAGLVMTTIAAATRVGRALATGLPLAALIGFQVFRVPAELILDELYREGVVPVQMTFEGLNFDIALGASAPLVAWLVARGKMPRWAVRVWNFAGLGLLAAVVTIASLSMPSPIRLFMNEPTNIIVASLPWAWLPTVLLMLALFGHLLVFRAVDRGGE